MSLKLKKRIVGFLLLIGIVLILIPLFFGRSVSIDELKSAGRIPVAPAKPAALSVAIPPESATVPPMAQVAVKPTTARPALAPASIAPANTAPSHVATPIANSQAVTTPLSIPAVQPPVANKIEPKPAAVPAAPVTSAAPQPQAKPQPTAATPHAATPTVPPKTTPAPAKAKAPTVPESSVAHKTADKQQHHKAEASGANKKAHPLPPAAEAWVVQLGTFSDKGNAEKLMKKLQSHGFSAYTRTMKTAKGANLTRVLVGPNLRRADALQLQARLQKELNLQSMVIRSPSL